MPEPPTVPPSWPGATPDEVKADVVEALAEADGPADASGLWPDTLWEILAEAGATRWALPGTEAPSRASLVRRYAGIAEGSLTAAFILTQHDAAVRRLAGPAAEGHATAARWLVEIADGRAFVTVGISQLTTSKRRGPTAMVATPRPGGGYRLDGAMPWVTAAERADVLVAGAVLADEPDRQMLVALPTSRPGLTVRPAFELAALPASRTTEVTCEGVEVADDEVLAGPVPDVMSRPGVAGTGGLETSALAMGQARAALAALAGEAPRRDDLDEPLDALIAEWSDLAGLLIAGAEGRPEAPGAATLRARANALVLRATQALLTARKGSGFLKSDPAQRWARQALFFLVWSCPSPVALAAIRGFAGLCPAD